MSAVVLLLLTAAELPPPRPWDEGRMLTALWDGSVELDLATRSETRRLAAESAEVSAEAEAFHDSVWALKSLPVWGPARPYSDPLRRFLAGRPEFAGLPLRTPADERLSLDDQMRLLDVAEANRSMHRDEADSPYGADLSPTTQARLSHDLRTAFTKDHGTESWGGRRSGTRLTPEQLKETGRFVRPLEQVFQPHAEEVRLQLVDAFRRAEGEGFAALARRALYDPSPRVRRAALAKIRSVDMPALLPTLVEALRSPLEPVADNAAAALADFGEKQVVPELRRMVDLPPPGEPYRDGGRWVRREVVRINHLDNCLLCHPASPPSPAWLSVTGALPMHGEPLPREAEPPHGVVYGHVVFLRPDFSQMHPVKPSSGRPPRQRFDYVLRVRPLTDAERREHLVRRAEGRPATYPQREAVRWAIRQLGGES